MLVLPSLTVQFWSVFQVDDSMDESELSAWDSDVDSLSSLVSCAESWAAEERFEKPAEGWFQQASVVLLVSGRARLAVYTQKNKKRIHL